MRRGELLETMPCGCVSYVQEADPVCGIWGAHGRLETAEGRDVRRNDRGRGLRRGQEKEWMGCLLADFRTLDVKADQWMAAA